MSNASDIFVIIQSTGHHMHLQPMQLISLEFMMLYLVVPNHFIDEKMVNIASKFDMFRKKSYQIFIDLENIQNAS